MGVPRLSGHFGSRESPTDTGDVDVQDASSVPVAGDVEDLLADIPVDSEPNTISFFDSSAHGFAEELFTRIRAAERELTGMPLPMGTICPPSGPSGGLSSQPPNCRPYWRPRTITSLSLTVCLSISTQAPMY